MSLSRRRFVFLTAFTGLWVRFGRLFAGDATNVDLQVVALEAWVDTLFPADGLSPSGSALGVSSQIFEKAASIPQ